jgi:hypothetical protein
VEAAILDKIEPLPRLDGDLHGLIRHFDVVLYGQQALADTLEMLLDVSNSSAREPQELEDADEKLLHCWAFARALADLASEGHVGGLACQLRSAQLGMWERAREARAERLGGAR